MFLRLDGLGNPVAFLDGDVKLLLETVDGSKEREALTYGDDADIPESFVVEQNKHIASDAV